MPKTFTLAAIVENARRHGQTIVYERGFFRGSFRPADLFDIDDEGWIYRYTDGLCIGRVAR